MPVGESTTIFVDVDPYVSRAAYKLIHALDDSSMRVAGRALDAGASTGGFTQVLLERGASTVYAVDVGHDQLHDSIRNDPRVVVHEGLNLRDLCLEDVGGIPVDIIVADVSFISLTLILARLAAVLSDQGSALILVKPQFEVGRKGLDSRGVVINDEVRQQGIDRVVSCANSWGWQLVWSAPSALTGEKGNQEFFCLFTLAKQG